MFKVYIWNKEDHVGITPAVEYLNSNPTWIYKDVLIVKYGETISEISEVDVIRFNYKLELDLNSEQICQEYEKILNAKLEYERNLPNELTQLKEQYSSLEQGLANAEYSLMMGGLL